MPNTPTVHLPPPKDTPPRLPDFPPGTIIRPPKIPSWGGFVLVVDRDGEWLLRHEDHPELHLYGDDLRPAADAALESRLETHAPGESEFDGPLTD